MSKAENIRRILSIDGGGIKGVIPAAFLATVEETTGKRILDHFDLIAGTSTGAIIALGLGLGLSSSEILEFYEREGPRIFSQTESQASFIDRTLARLRSQARGVRRILLPKYDPAALRAAIEKAFGQRLLGESRTRLIIPAFDSHRREVHVFKTPHHERFVVDWRQRAADVALASAAAPTYLPGHLLDNGVSLLDGGIWANNPVGLAVVESIGVLSWPRDSIYVLSIGCSEEAITIPDRSGLLGLMRKMEYVFFLGQSRGSLGTAKLLTGHTESNPKLFRYQYIAGNDQFTLDDTNKITVLKGIGAGMAREAMPQISQVFLNSQRPEYIPCYGPGADTNL